MTALKRCFSFRANITATRPEVAGSVASHINPITALNPGTDGRLMGIDINSVVAAYRIHTLL